MIYRILKFAYFCVMICLFGIVLSSSILFELNQKAVSRNTRTPTLDWDAPYQYMGAVMLLESLPQSLIIAPQSTSGAVVIPTTKLWSFARN
jgi:hypothetical protein